MAKTRQEIDFVVNGQGTAPSFFERVETSLKGIRKSAPSEALEEIGKLMRGAGVAGAGFFLLDEMADGADRAREAMEKLHEGTITQTQALAEFGRSIPIFGRLVGFGDSIAKFIIEAGVGVRVNSDKTYQWRLQMERLRDEQKALAAGFRDMAVEAQRATREMGLSGIDLLRARGEAAEAGMSRQMFELFEKRRDPNLTDEAQREADAALDAIIGQLGKLRSHNARAIEVAATQQRRTWDAFVLDVRRSVSDVFRDLGQSASGGFGSFIDQIRDNLQGVEDAERMIRDMRIEALDLQAQAGNLDARRAAERLRFEADILEKRKAAEEMLRSPGLGFNLQQQLRDEIAGLDRRLADGPRRVVRPTFGGLPSTVESKTAGGLVQSAERRDQYPQRIAKAAEETAKAAAQTKVSVDQMTTFLKQVFKPSKALDLGLGILTGRF